MDYSVVSEQMFLDYSDFTRTIITNSTDFENTDFVQNFRSEMRPSSLYYTEQLVVFDSLAHYLDDPLHIHALKSATTSTSTSHLSVFEPVLSPSSLSPQSSSLSPSLSSSLSLFAKTESDTVETDEELLFNPITFAFNSSCESIDIFLSSLGIVDLTAEMIGNCYIVSSSTIESEISTIVDTSSISPPLSHSLPKDVQVDEIEVDASGIPLHNNTTAISINGRPVHSDEISNSEVRLYVQKKIHLYGCMQLPKKMHPAFDRILSGVLKADPTGLILVMERARDLMPRWAGVMAGMCCTVWRNLCTCVISD